MSIHKVKSGASFAEFVALLAFAMSLVALAIDAMLPALPDMGASFGIEQANNQQFIITSLFGGLAVGQLVAGPLSDAIGRKNGIYIGLVFFIIGSLMSYFAKSYDVMMLGRFVQGLGASGPRVITIAMVRDWYSGREMARVMSYIMGVFILVPALAPAMGQGIIILAGWRTIFLVFIAIAVAIAVWMALRLPETLHPEDKRPFTLPTIIDGILAVGSNRTTRSYMIAAGCIFGAFIGYLNSSQQIFQDYYNVGEMFAVYFGVVALAIGFAFFVNAMLVRKYGMRFIVFWSLVMMAVLATLFAGFEVIWHGHIPLQVFMTFIMASAFFMGMLFGNFNALAMEPMGHMAGIASAVIGCVSLVISLIVGGAIGLFYNGSLIPVTGGFLLLSLLSLTLMALAEKGD